MTVKIYMLTLAFQGVSMPGIGGQYAPEYPVTAFGVILYVVLILLIDGLFTATLQKIFSEKDSL